MARNPGPCVSWIVRSAGRTAALMLVGESLAGSICGVSTASETPLIVTIVPTKMRGGPVIDDPIDRRERLG